MKEYIARESALAALMNDGCMANNLETIMNVPAADVVEVVRCKDCCYGTQKVDIKGVVRICNLRDDNNFAVMENDFCSCGEVKE